MKYNKGFAGVGVIIAVIVALAVGGGVVYYATKTPAPSSNTEENNYPPVEQNYNPPVTNNNNPPTQPPPSPNSKKVAFVDILNLVKSGESYQCSYATSTGDGGLVVSTVAKFYFSGGKLRIESTGNIKSINFYRTDYTIADNDYLYQWDVVTSKGEDASDAPIKISRNMDGNYALVQDIYYLAPGGDGKADAICIPWVADMSKFIPPSDIQFKSADTSRRNAAVLLTSEFKIQGTDFIANGRYLTKVEILESLDRNVSRPNAKVIGTATLRSTNDAGIQTWVFPVPNNKEGKYFFAVGYENDKIISFISLTN